jgi:type IV secretion system protein VirD4
VVTRSVTSGEQLGRSSSQVSTSNLALAPPHALRQMRPGDALLLHGTLPPAHVRTRPYYRDRRLAERAALAPTPADPGESTALAVTRHLTDRSDAVPGDSVDEIGA